MATHKKGKGDDVFNAAELSGIILLSNLDLPEDVQVYNALWTEGRRRCSIPSSRSVSKTKSHNPFPT